MKEITPQQLFLMIWTGDRSMKNPWGVIDGREKYLVNLTIFRKIKPYLHERVVVVPKVKKIYILRPNEWKPIFGHTTVTKMKMKEVRVMLT